MRSLTKFGSSQAMVPTGVFVQELHMPTISIALAKAKKAVESSQGVRLKRRPSHLRRFRYHQTA
jgi:hypothetical protein